MRAADIVRHKHHNGHILIMMTPPFAPLATRFVAALIDLQVRVFLGLLLLLVLECMFCPPCYMWISGFTGHVTTKPIPLVALVAINFLCAMLAAKESACSFFCVWLAFLLSVGGTYEWFVSAGTAVPLFFFLMVIIDWLYCCGLICPVEECTIGYKLMRLKLVTADGDRVYLGRATARYLVGILSDYILCIGHVLGLFSARKQCLHDRATGCVVVRNVIE